MEEVVSKSTQDSIEMKNTHGINKNSSIIMITPLVKKLINN